MASSKQSGCGCSSASSAVSRTNGNAQFLQDAIPACTQEVTAEVCAQATVTLTPRVQAEKPIVTCINGPLVNTSCIDVPGFEPLNNNGTCTFTVSQVICVTIPLDFSVDVDAVPSGGACGEVVAGDICPSALNG